MKIQELRIGNWFIGYNGKPFQWSLEHFELLTLEKNRPDIDEIIKSPIPLTEEILLKCGFSDKDYKQGYTGIDYESGAMTIARTEVAQMAVESQRQGAEAWKAETNTALYKMWMHRGAKDPRAHHVALDGVTIPEGEQFQIVDEYGVEYADYPHAENLSARNVVNCSCTVTYVSEAYYNARLRN